MTLFSLMMVALVDLSVIFWVGAQFWHTFVLQRVKRANQEQRAIYQRVRQRFDRLFSWPVLLVLLIANVGVLVSGALSLTGGRWDQAFVPALRKTLVTNGLFGIYWVMCEVLIILAIALVVYTLLFKQRSRFVNDALPWVNLLLGFALLIAITLSGHATAVSGDLVVYSVLLDGLHLLGAALWIGSILYIVTSYLPVLRSSPPVERARSLIRTLPRYSLFALVGIIIIAITGPLNATVHINSWNQLLTTPYGRALVVKALLVVTLLLTVVSEVLLFRPQLATQYKKYLTAIDAVKLRTATGPNRLLDFTAQQVKRLEERMSTATSRLMSVLRWESLLGVAIILCSGVLTVFAGTLSSATAQTQPTTQSKPFHTTVLTTDHTFTVEFDVSPNRFGTNLFTVSTLNSQGVLDTHVVVSLTTTMLDMDMGTNSITLQPDGKDHFSARGELSMGGNWQIRILIRTPDGTLHVATVKFFTPF